MSAKIGLPSLPEINGKRHLLASVLILTGLFINSDIRSQIPHPIFSHYEVEDGLPSSEVHHAMQDSKGYMWFATDMGVSRFDGYKFQNYSFTRGLPDNTIFNIYEDYCNRIWFISFSGRLSFFHDGAVTAYKYNNVLEKEVTSLFKGSFYVDKEDALFIGTSAYGYLKINSEGVITRHETDNFDAIGIVNLDSTRVFVYGGPKRTRKGQFEIITGLDTSHVEFKDLDHRTNIRCISLQNNELIYTSGRVVTSLTSSLTISNYTITHDALTILEDQDKNIWIGTYQGGALYYADGLSGKAPSRYLDGLSISSVTQDIDGGLWFTTLEDGVYYLASNKYLTYNKESGLDGQKVICLASDYKSTIYAGLRNGTLYSITDSVFSRIQLNSNPTPGILTLFFDTTVSKLWVGAPLADLTIDQSGINYLEGEGGSHAILQSADQSIWMGTHNQLKQLKEMNEVYSSFTHRVRFRVTAIHEDLQGTLWVGNLHGLWKLEDSTLVSAHDLDPLLRFRISDIDEVNGYLCLGTRGAGLLILRNDSIIQINHDAGLSSDNVNDIFIDGNDIWLATNRGVNRISITGYDNFSYEISVYSRADGLASDEVNQVMKFRGHIWAATNKGLTFFDANAISRDGHGPRIYIDGIAIMGRDTTILNSYELAYDQNEFAIQYTGLSYKNAGQLQYRLKVEGIDSEWVYTRNTSIRYPALPPGSYVFHVSARNDAGQWSENAASFRLIVRPPFWDTWWFRFGIALSVIGAVYAFLKIRILTYNRDIVRELMIELLNRFRKNESLIVKLGSNLVKINIRSILWIKAVDNYVEIITKDQKYLVRSTLDGMYKELPTKLDFLKVHRSYIIQLSRVQSVEKNAVKINNETIPVSRVNKHKLKILKEHLLLMKT